MKLYGMRMSGNCWKVAQILALTGRAFDWIETDGNNGATRAPAFLAINPNAKVPAVVLDDGTALVESNAILLHFAEGTAWLPPPGLPRTRVHEWLFFEQYSHEPYIAVARNLIAWRREAHLHAERLAECARRGGLALDVMERRLAQHDWLVGEAPTIADLALFAYTHRADEGGFSWSHGPACRHGSRGSPPCLGSSPCLDRHRHVRARSRAAGIDLTTALIEPFRDELGFLYIPFM